ncbi:ABC transporter permease [Paenarthrobacter sp. PH39-S1]|uniref:ABC transporter permease n=1 Tax=Paenarthrobacter sp. PH39-S1 TaxID=3046204 RepID=UPI0024BA0BD0|nr:ABC transporter permease [Paenarthrobacter sp. PH39-S1]MDJ0358180.1 ABC transporter permease [Paenarthrobacter sp. PH39-S1]
MVYFIFRRLGLAALSLWGVATIVFVMSRLIPGDIAGVAAGRFASAEQIEHVRETLGLNKPLVVQYWDFLVHAVHGDLGTSAYTHQSVVSGIGAVLPATIQLVVCGMIITILLAVPLGVLSAVNEGRGGDTAIRLILVLEGGVPVFWLAIMLRWIFGSILGWFPISSTNSLNGAPPHVTGFSVLDSLLFGDFSNVLDSVGHLLLPAIALSAPFIATLARNVRSNMMSALKSDYITFAVSKGVPPGRIVIHHGLRSALGSTLTIAGMQFGWMVSSAVLVEAVFSLPGVGSYMYHAIVNHDTFAVLGAVLIIGFVFIVTALIVDLVQMSIDPRVRNVQVGVA